MTALNIDDMPSDVQDAWLDSLDLYEKADPNMESFLRAVKNTLYDPTTLGGIVLTGGLAGAAKLIGGKAASAAARFFLKSS